MWLYDKINEQTLARRSIVDLSFAESLSVVWGEVLIVSIYVYTADVFSSIYTTHVYIPYVWIQSIIPLSVAVMLDIH